MAKYMSNYLTSVTADYTAESLIVKPHNILVEAGSKEQFIHRFSDGQTGVVSLSDASRFTAKLQWDIVGPDDAEDIMDMWHNQNKANGMARSFYWLHPIESTYYTVKFQSPLQMARRAVLPGFQSVDQVELNVLGVKP